MTNALPRSMSGLLSICLGCLSFIVAAQSPALLRDINTLQASSSPNGLQTANNFVYFNADDGVHGRELWKSDGTEAGTEMVRDIASGEEDSNPENFCNVNGTVFFTATTPQYGTELWKTDGTPAGTVLVADLLAGFTGSNPENLVSCNGKIFFTVKLSPGLAEDIRLFVSDGTANGTVEIVSPDAVNLFAPKNLLSMWNTLYFATRHGIDGEELWQTDGTLAGTKMVRNLNPNAFSSSNPDHLCTDGIDLYFSADDGTGRQMWQYKPANNHMLRRSNLQLQNGNVFGEVVWHFSNAIFFTAASLAPAPAGYELYRLNSAAPNGATKITGASKVGNLKMMGLKLCFTQALTNGPRLSYVLSNSNSAVTLKTFALIPNGDYPMPEGFVVANSKLFFTAVTAANGRELWKSNGTAAGTVIMADYTPGANGSDFSNLCWYSNKILFGCKGVDGNELRSTDGTAITTISDISHGDSNPEGFVKMDNTTYFSANEGIHGAELWKTDGTTGGTVLLSDIYSGAKGSSPSDFLVVTASNGAKTLFFVAFDAGTGRELYKLENTPNAVPVRISDIVAGAGGSNIGNLTNVNGTLHFTATNGVWGDRIYKVNTARTGVETTGGNILFADNLVAKGSILFFTQKSLGDEPMLCKLVGGATSTVKIFVPNWNPRNLTLVGNYLYFSAGDAQRGRELWRTNAAATTAIPISDIRPGLNSSNPANLTNFNGVLHFTAQTDNLNVGPQIFKTNAALTGVVAIGGPVSWAFDLKVAGNRLFFFQTIPGEVSVKLCILENGIATPIKSFGPLEGVLPVSKIGMTVAGSNVYFGAYTSENGIELWKSNGTEAGTVFLSDIRPGAIGCNLLEMRLAGSDIYLSAHNLAYAQEPWKIADATALDDGGDERSEIVAIAPAMGLRVWPNPGSDYVQVEFPKNNMAGTISLATLSGQILRSVQISEGERSAQMDLQDLPRGLYMLRFAQPDGEVLVQKVVLQ